MQMRNEKSDVRAINLFDEDWSVNFKRRWNASVDKRLCMASAGPVTFCVIDGKGQIDVTLFWNAEGIVDISPEGNAAHNPFFQGDTAAWEEVMSGQRSALGAVMSRRIVYRGPFSFAVKFGKAFDIVARVALAAANEPVCSLE